jgi:hypothetical protein
LPPAIQATPWIWYSKPPPEKIGASAWKNGQTPVPGF